MNNMRIKFIVGCGVGGGGRSLLPGAPKSLDYSLSMLFTGCAYSINKQQQLRHKHLQGLCLMNNKREQ